MAYRERQEEEPGGDPHASYAYAAATAGAKAAGTEAGAEVRLMFSGAYVSPTAGLCPLCADSKTASIPSSCGWDWLL